MKVQVKMFLSRETKGTYFFEAKPGGEDKVPSLYVRKSCMPSGAPESITLTIEADG